MNVEDTEQAKAAVSSIFGEVRYLYVPDRPSNELSFITPVMKERDFDGKISQVHGDVVSKIRVLDI